MERGFEGGLEGTFVEGFEGAFEGAFEEGAVDFWDFGGSSGFWGFLELWGGFDMILLWCNVPLFS